MQVCDSALGLLRSSLNIQCHYSNFHCSFVYSLHFLCQGARHRGVLADVNFIMEDKLNDGSSGFHPVSRTEIDNEINSVNCVN
jgi:hypothetical protein